MPSKGLQNQKCRYCDRRFGKAEHLKRHQRAHTGEKPFQCSHCGREYARSDVLIRHVRNHHSENGKQNVPRGPASSSQEGAATGPNNWEVLLLDAVSLTSSMKPSLSNEPVPETAGAPGRDLATIDAGSNGPSRPLLKSPFEASISTERGVPDPFAGL